MTFENNFVNALSFINFLKTIVVITGTSDELMLKALDTIINRNQLAILEANVVVVNDSGKINTIASYDKNQIHLPLQNYWAGKRRSLAYSPRTSSYNTRC
jgi:hypothetical protein